MSKRFSTPAVRARVYNYLVNRDGEKCAICGKTPNQLLQRGQNPVMDIDHADGNPNNDALRNRRLLCHRCNAREGQRQLQCDGGERELGVINKAKEMELKEGHERARVTKKELGYQMGDPSMRANAQYRPAFEAWLIKQIQIKGFLSWKDARFGGAYVIGCANKVAEGYIEELVSPWGPLDVTDDRLLILKTHLQPIESHDNAAHHLPSAPSPAPEDIGEDRGNGHKSWPDGPVVKDTV